MHRSYFPVLLFTVLALIGCENNAPPPTHLVEGPAAFVGSSSCQGCHRVEYDDWLGSHHELAMQVATAATVLGNFDDVALDYYGATTRFFSREDNFYVLTADESGQEREYRIAFVFGVEPLQQYLIEFPGGRLQTLAFSWDARAESEGGQRWFHIYPDENIPPGDELHWTGPQQNWNYMCAECHSTDLKMGYDAATDAFDTTYEELSVGCESCHGPASQHAQLAETGSLTESHGLQVDLDDQGTAAWVMNADSGIAERSEEHATPQQQPEACGRCHARRGVIAPDYEYGEPLAHTHRPALLQEGLYFDDGQILEEVYVYNSFIQSRMYAAGVTCSDCHNPHSTKLVTGANPNDVCAQCHLPTKFATTEHAAHSPEQVGCVDCHMTSRTYMVVDDRRDHSFRTPRPDLTEAIGTPNACSNCHAEQDAAWAVAAVNEWRGPDADPLRPHFATALAAGRNGFANALLLDVATNDEYPGIARATAVAELAQPFGRREGLVLEAALRDADPLIRMAALRQLRTLPGEARLQLPGAELLADPVRGVRIEAVSTYAGMSDLLPLEEARAWSLAETEFREAYEMLANRPEALVALAVFEAAQRDVSEAVRLYERALRIDPRSTLARANLADVMRQLGEEVRGEMLLREGLELNPQDAALRHALGLSLVRSGHTDEALVELRQAAELAPDNPRYRYVLAIGLNSLGHEKEAINTMGQAYLQFDGDFEIAMVLATMLRESGNQEGALAVAYALARRHPEDQNVVALLRSLDAIP